LVIRIGFFVRHSGAGRNPFAFEGLKIKMDEQPFGLL